MRTIILLSLAAALAPSDARAETRYFYSGAACQPDRAADYTFSSSSATGLGNIDTAPFGADLIATCPVTALQGTSFGQLALEVRVWDGSNATAVSGNWQIFDPNLNLIYQSSIKFSCATATGCPGITTFAGGSTLQWSGPELSPFIHPNTAHYSFRPRIPSRCRDTTCGGTSRVIGYSVTHHEP